MSCRCLRQAKLGVHSLARAFGSMARSSSSMEFRTVPALHRAVRPMCLVNWQRDIVQHPNAIALWQPARTLINVRHASSKPEHTKETEEEEDEGPNWKLIVGIGLFAASLGAFINIRHYERTQRQLAEKEKATEANVGVGGASITGQSVGRPDLGGDFMLVNQDGKLTKNTDFKGQWMYIYFGFTYCPDICPNELMRMVEVLDTLDKDTATANKVVPIFVTIDPERDGPKQLKDYLEDWHPRLVGLTGSPDQIKEVCSKFRVYYSKARMGNNPQDYLIDHSVMFYLVDPAGQFTEYYGQNLSPEEMHRKIAQHIRSFRG